MSMIVVGQRICETIPFNVVFIGHAVMLSSLRHHGSTGSASDRGCYLQDRVTSLDDGPRTSLTCASHGGATASAEHHRPARYCNAIDLYTPAELVYACISFESSSACTYSRSAASSTSAGSALEGDTQAFLYLNLNLARLACLNNCFSHYMRDTPAPIHIH